MGELAIAEKQFETLAAEGGNRHGDGSLSLYFRHPRSTRCQCKPAKMRPVRLRYRPQSLAQAHTTPQPESVGQSKGLRRITAALHHRDFRVLWFGACFSSIGTWMQSLAENWLVLSLTASAFYLGLDAFLQQLPIMLFTLIGGVVAESPRSALTLIASQWVQLATAATLAVLVFSGGVQVWHILVLSFITGTAQAFGGPAYQSLIPSLVGKQDLTNAIALNSIQFNVARMLGPLLAGGTLAVLKRWGVPDMTALAICFGLNALSFLAVILSLMSLHIKHLLRRARTHVRRAEAGPRLRAETRSIMALMVLGAATTFFGIPMLTLLPVFAREFSGLAWRATARCSHSRALARSLAR